MSTLEQAHAYLADRHSGSIPLVRWLQLMIMQLCHSAVCISQPAATNKATMCTLALPDAPLCTHSCIVFSVTQWAS